MHTVDKVTRWVLRLSVLASAVLVPWLSAKRFGGGNIDGITWVTAAAFGLVIVLTPLVLAQLLAYCLRRRDASERASRSMCVVACAIGGSVLISLLSQAVVIVLNSSVEDALPGWLLYRPHWALAHVALLLVVVLIWRLAPAGRGG